MSRNDTADCGSLSLSVSPLSVWYRPAHHIRGAGRDADGSARLALPGALHSAHQSYRRPVPQGTAPVLDWKWICGEYQFDMTAERTTKKKTQKTCSWIRQWGILSWVTPLNNSTHSSFWSLSPLLPIALYSTVCAAEDSAIWMSPQVFSLIWGDTFLHIYDQFAQTHIVYSLSD